MNSREVASLSVVIPFVHIEIVWDITFPTFAEKNESLET